jgi:hypothetical protein
VSRFRQITTSLERLLALIRPPHDCNGARDASPRAALSRRRDWLCDGRVDSSGAHVIFARASSIKSSTVRDELDQRAVVALLRRYHCAEASRQGLPAHYVHTSAVAKMI